MPVVYVSSLKTARMNEVKSAIDADAAAGTCRIYTTGGSASGTLLVSMTLAYPCGTVSGDTLTLDNSGPVTGTAASTGIAAVAEIFDNSGDQVVSGLTVNTSGANINISSTSISTSDTVSLTGTNQIVHG